MKAGFAALLIALGLQACATVDQDVAFDTAQGETFALVAADGINENLVGSYTYVFRRVDLATSSFEKEWFGIVFDAGAGTFVTQEFRKPASMQTTLRFGGRAVIPGDYALISRNDHRTYGVSTMNCYALGAPVFRISPDSINIVAIDDDPISNLLDEKVALAQGEQVLTLYPKLVAQRRVAEQVGSITFQPEKALGSQVCSKRDMKPFSFTPARSKAPAP